MIQAGDRVATVIGMDESLVDVFVSLSPAFERLRSPAMRRVMARLVTVEQAARMAGVDVRELVQRLNAHAAADGDAGAEAATAVAGETAGDSSAAKAGGAAMPPGLAGIPPERRVELDVRPQLRAGQEPFSLIMAARRQVPPGGALAVRATFEPVPLYAFMQRQGLMHVTEKLADDDWRVWFYAGGGSTPAEPTEHGVVAPEATIENGDRDVVVLDVRALEPPEPMMRTLAALEHLPASGTLVQLNVRVPQFLLPLLEERGFTYEVREQEPGLVRVFIRHRAA